MMDKQASEIKTAAPTFYSSFIYNNTCNFYPKAKFQTDFDKTVPDSPDILLIGTTRDPATPYQSAVNLQKEMKHATLLGYDSDGHTAYTSGSSTVRNKIDDYLINGKLPNNGEVVK
jgi:hypothetical protein